jgi:heterodisulfide reductase subunit A-like polyferredoxin
VRTDAAEPIAAGAEYLAADDAAPDAGTLLERLRDAARMRLVAGRRQIAANQGLHVFLCTCNDSVHHREIVGLLAEEAAAIPGVARATILNTACQLFGAQQIASALASGQSGRVLLAACLCCPLEILCGSCTHQRARAKSFLFSGEGIPPELVETVNLRDEVLNQAELGGDEALRLARRTLRSGIDRALAGGFTPAPACERELAAVSPTASRRDGHPAPLLLPGAAVAAASIQAALCRGCGTCAKNCPQEAIVLDPRPSGIPLARVLPAACTLCGRCLAVCPVGAPDAFFAGHRQVREALGAALSGDLHG